MRTLYLDCFAGIAGDMLIGALLNLVPSPQVLRDGIKKLTALSPDEYELVIEPGLKNGIAGINFDVITYGRHEHAFPLCPHSRTSPRKGGQNTPSPWIRPLSVFGLPFQGRWRACRAGGVKRKVMNTRTSIITSTATFMTSRP